MPKILRIINRFNLGGPTYNAAHLARGLQPDFETLLVGGDREATEESSFHILHKLGIEPRIIPNMQRDIHPTRDRLAYSELKKIIREFKPDIVHTHASKAGAIGRLAAIHTGVPVIVHTFHGHVFHSYFGMFKTSFYKGMERYLASKSDAIVVISDKQKNEICLEHRICPPEKARVIELGFDLAVFSQNTEQKRAAFRNQYQIEDEEIAIGIIGRLVPVKNHKMFIDGLADVLANTDKKVRAFIIGDGEVKNSLIDYARSKNVEPGENGSVRETLVFTSWIRDIDLALAGLDIVALTSLNEGTPVSIIEAQAAARPIVSTNVGGIEDIVKNGETALLCKSNDYREFSLQLQSLINNPELRSYMGIAGRDLVKGRFSAESLSANMASLYHGLLENQLKRQ